MKITDISIPFWSQVEILYKFFFASIVAGVLVAITVAAPALLLFLAIGGRA